MNRFIPEWTHWGNCEIEPESWPGGVISLSLYFIELSAQNNLPLKHLEKNKKLSARCL